MPIAEAFLTITGPIERGPHLLYWGENKDKPATKFAVPYLFRHKKETVEQWFNCVAYGRMAEHIATHYTKGKQIIILKARPYRDSVQTQWGLKWMQSWMVEEIGVPFADGPRPGVSLEGTVTEVLLQDEDEDE
ncbi:MAG: single-stranded DNA-binding protein [Deferrisomatales bacterium]|nr:single-stranded DNA-binding protein [Deferrisomatales bacterium]